MARQEEGLSLSIARRKVCNGDGETSLWRRFSLPPRGPALAKHDMEHPRRRKPAGQKQERLSIGRKKGWSVRTKNNPHSHTHEFNQLSHIPSRFDAQFGRVNLCESTGCPSNIRHGQSTEVTHGPG